MPASFAIGCRLPCLQSHIVCGPLLVDRESVNLHTTRPSRYGTSIKVQRDLHGLPALNVLAHHSNSCSERGSPSSSSCPGCASAASRWCKWCARPCFRQSSYSTSYTSSRQSASCQSWCFYRCTPNMSIKLLWASLPSTKHQKNSLDLVL